MVQVLESAEARRSWYDDLAAAVELFQNKSCEEESALSLCDCFLFVALCCTFLHCAFTEAAYSGKCEAK